MLLTPGGTLRSAAGEHLGPAELYRSHVIPLALIPPVCSVVGILVFGGFQVASVGVRLNPLGAAIEGLAGFITALLMVFALALVVAQAAPRFGGLGDRGQALKLVALCGTAVWIAGVFGIYPALGVPAAILGAIWSLYALYVGLPEIMRVDRDRAITCFALILLAAIVLVVARSFLMAWAAEFGGPLVAA